MEFVSLQKTFIQTWTGINMQIVKQITNVFSRICVAYESKIDVCLMTRKKYVNTGYADEKWVFNGLYCVYKYGR